MPVKPAIRYWEACLAAALTLVFGYSTFSSLSIPDRAFFGGDTWEYQSIAVNFAAGKGFRFGGLLPFETYKFDSADPKYYEFFTELGASGGVPSTFRTPGYPFILGLIYKVFGVSPRIAITIQIGWLLVICALLPTLGHGLFGRGGFPAGLLAGVIFHRLAPGFGGRILTEALIALVLFLVLFAWVLMNRRQQPSIGVAVVFGLTLAGAVLTKGSLIFLPPLFLAYIAIQVWRKRVYRPSILAACGLAFALPVGAYSFWATNAHGSFVLLSRQGPSVLLAGHNETAVKTGGWSPQWKEDPDSFFNRQLTLHPGRSPFLMMVSFYAENPVLLARSIPRKLVAMFGTKTAFLLGIVLLFEVVVIANCMVQNRRLQRFFIFLSLFAVIGIAIGASSPEFRALIVVLFFGPCLAMFAVGCFNGCVRKEFAALWSAPGWVAVTLVVTNYVLVAVVFFGDPRFFAPARYVLILTAMFLLIRMVQGLKSPENLTLGPHDGIS